MTGVCLMLSASTHYHIDLYCSCVSSVNWNGYVRGWTLSNNLHFNLIILLLIVPKIACDKNQQNSTLKCVSFQQCKLCCFATQILYLRLTLWTLFRNITLWNTSHLLWLLANFRPQFANEVKTIVIVSSVCQYVCDGCGLGLYRKENWNCQRTPLPISFTVTDGGGVDGAKLTWGLFYERSCDNLMTKIILWKS